jgi:hypothetical protein
MLGQGSVPCRSAYLNRTVEPDCWPTVIMTAAHWHADMGIAAVLFVGSRTGHVLQQHLHTSRSACPKYTLHGGCSTVKGFR